MSRTIADALKDEGRKEGRTEGLNRGLREGELRVQRRTLLRHLRTRFGPPSQEITHAVENTDDPTRLDAWLDRVLTAKDLSEMGIE